MGEYKTLSLKNSDFQQKFDLGSKKTNSIYSKLKPLIRHKESLPITSISLPNISDSKFAISYGTKVSIYDYLLDSNYFNYTGASSFIRSTSFRNDSKLLIASDDAGTIHLIAMTLKSLISKFTGHEGAVYATCFSDDKTHFFSASDDKTSKYWDISESTCISTFIGHSDRIRSIALQLNTRETNVFATGGYDSTALVYDTRTMKNIFELKNDAPINCVNYSPDNSLFLIADSNGYISLYDVSSGYKLIVKSKIHTKAITRAFVLDDILVSSSLDSTVKFKGYKNDKIEHTFYTPSPVISLDIALDGKSIGYGMESGEWCIRQRKVASVQETVEALTRVQISESKNVCNLLQVTRYNSGDLSRLDRLLKTFQYKTALDLSLDLTLGHVLSVIEELLIRGGLESAVTRNDERSIVKILNFINSHFGINSTSMCLLELLDAIIERNKSLITQCNNIEIIDLLNKIKQKLGMELHHRQIMHQMIGTIDLVLSHSHI